MNNRENIQKKDTKNNINNNKNKNKYNKNTSTKKLIINTKVSKVNKNNKKILPHKSGLKTSQSMKDFSKINNSKKIITPLGSYMNFANGEGGFCKKVGSNIFPNEKSEFLHYEIIEMYKPRYMRNTQNSKNNIKKKSHSKLYLYDDDNIKSHKKIYNRYISKYNKLSKPKKIRRNNSNIYKNKYN